MISKKRLLQKKAIPSDLASEDEIEEDEEDKSKSQRSTKSVKALRRTPSFIDGKKLHTIINLFSCKNFLRVQ